MLPIALVTAGFIAVLCSIPQFFQLIKQKRSDEFNLFSWVVWIVYQIIALIYTLNIKAYPYAVINSLWITFYIIMVVLIVKYRVKPGKNKTARYKIKKYRVN